MDLLAYADLHGQHGSDSTRYSCSPTSGQGNDPCCRLRVHCSRSCMGKSATLVLRFAYCKRSLQRLMHILFLIVTGGASQLLRTCILDPVVRRDFHVLCPFTFGTLDSSQDALPLVEPFRGHLCPTQRHSFYDIDTPDRIHNRGMASWLYQSPKIQLSTRLRQGESVLPDDVFFLPPNCPTRKHQILVDQGYRQPTARVPLHEQGTATTGFLLEGKHGHCKD